MTPSLSANHDPHIFTPLSRLLTSDGHPLSAAAVRRGVLRCRAQAPKANLSNLKQSDTEHAHARLFTSYNLGTIQLKKKKWVVLFSRTQRDGRNRTREHRDKPSYLEC